MDENIFGSLTEEQIAQLLRGQGLSEEGSLLDAQLAALLADDPQHIQRASPLGAGLGGLAEAIDGIAGAFHAKALRGERKENLSKQDQMMQEFAKLLRSGQQPATGLAANQPKDSTTITPEWGLDMSAPGNQPTNPTELTDSWGLDMSQPADRPNLADASSVMPTDVLPDMTQLPKRKGSLARARPFIF